MMMYYINKADHGNTTKMKISKRRLKRIIREEYQRILKEMNVGMSPNQGSINEDLMDEILEFIIDESGGSIIPSREEILEYFPTANDATIQAALDRVPSESFDDDWEATNPEPQLQPGVESMFGYKGDGSNMNAPWGGRGMRESKRILKNRLKRILANHQRH